MDGKNILVSWIGKADVRAMANSLNEGKLNARVQEILGDARAPEEKGAGPVRTLVSQRKFDEIHLLSQWPDDVNQHFASWSNCSPHIHFIEKSRLPNPSDYRNVYVIANGVLEKIHKQHCRLSIFLTPGTPTMAAVWVLLGKTRFPATLLQSYNGEVNEAVIPFDIVMDVIPEYLRNSDRQLQELALSSPGDVRGFEDILGSSTALKLAVARAARVAIRDVTTLITGESGTGKEMFARAIHRASHRGRNDPRFQKFVAFNCAAIPSTLFESELFGVEKGAFTNATETRAGAFERANGGTLFLDEVGELAIENQAKLLRAMQPPPDGGSCQRVIRHVGGKEDISCDVRIVAATNRDLLEAIKARQFRDDLFYRLAIIQIRLPTLRDRRKDIDTLAASIISRLNDDFKKSEPSYEPKKLHPSALKRLRRYNWPGNIREFNNVVTQAAVLAGSSEISSSDIDSAIASFDRAAEDAVFSRSRGDEFDLNTRLAKIEHAFLQDALHETGGNQSKAAKLLGISQQSMNQKLKKSGGSIPSVAD